MTARLMFQLLQPSGAIVIFTIALFLAMTPMAHAAQAPSPNDPAVSKQLLSKLRPSHPRLLTTADDLIKLKARLKTEPQLRAYHAELQKRGRKILTDPVSHYDIPDGKRLLAVSRRVHDVSLTLGLLYLLDGDERYRDRLWRELEAAAAFKDWNPSHFLDTAEMAQAFAIAYDWLYDAWSPQQRKTLRDVMVKHALQPALRCYRGQETYGWWVGAQNNWNQVCNGGIVTAALALADEEPEIAREILQGALASLPRAMKHFAPDGAWNEGPMYWHYTLRYTVPLIISLENSLGDDFGIADFVGFDKTGLFPIHLMGPTDEMFDFADAHGGAVRAPEWWWLATRFNQPVYGQFQRHMLISAPVKKPGQDKGGNAASLQGVRAYDLLWSRPVDDAAPLKLPLDAYFAGLEAATMRGAWDDRDAWYIGFKAGDNQVNHGHLDIGSFVLDAGGHRWIMDPGSDDYNLPAYFGSERWTYYRLRAEGHNTLVINPGLEPDQNPKAVAKISRFESKPGRALAIADLTPAYDRDARSVRRGITLYEPNDGKGRAAVMLRDEIELKEPGDVWWFLHTRAKVTISADGRGAELAIGEDRLLVRLVTAPADAKFTVRKAEPLPTSPKPAKQGDNKGVNKLTLHLPDTKQAVIQVNLSMLKTGAPDGKARDIPLDRW